MPAQADLEQPMANGGTPLFIARYKGQQGAVDVLLSNGALDDS